MLLAAVAVGCLTSQSHAVVSATGLEVYYTFDAGSVTATTVTDQWTADGVSTSDNLARTTLSTFSSGAKFGDALATTTDNATPRANTSTAAEINSTYLPGTGDYTLSLWYRQSGGNNRIFGAGARNNDGNNDDGLQLYLLSNGSIEVAYHDPAAAGTTRDSFTAASGGTFDGVSWNHIALVRNTSTDLLSLWVNGIMVGSQTIADSYNIAVGTGTFFREANFGPGATVANSAYDDTAIWHRALSNTEISELWNNGTGQTVAAAMIPEPSVALLGGLGALGLLRRRRNR